MASLLSGERTGLVRAKDGKLHSARLVQVRYVLKGERVWGNGLGDGAGHESPPTGEGQVHRPAIMLGRVASDGVADVDLRRVSPRLE